MVNILFQKDVLPLKDRFYRLALRITLNQVEAEDVVQETLIRIWQNKEKLEDRDAIQAFGYTVCRRLALDCASKAGRGNVTLDLDRHDTSAVLPSEQMDRQEQMALVRKLMDELPEVQRSIMELRDIEGKSYQEIANILQLTEPQVKVYLHRARNKVRIQAEQIERYGL
mgnify:CR=1 FL=1